MPDPPPNGVSSTVLCLSSEKSRTFITSKFQILLDKAYIFLKINEIQKFISSSKLENIFHLQKNTVKVKEEIKELYLTRTQTLITFSILGFIVGFILGSNFLAVLKENK